MQKQKRPRIFQIVFLNDNKTPTDFLMATFEKIFHKNTRTAAEMVMNIHINGYCSEGEYTYEIAETRMSEIRKRARKGSYAVQCEIEPLS